MLKEDFEKALAHQKALKKLDEKPNIPTENYFLHFGYTLKKQRTLYGITLEELANEAGTYRSRLSEFETGKRLPTIRTLEVITSTMIELGAPEEVEQIISEAFEKTLLHRKKSTVAAVFRVESKPIFKYLREQERKLKAMEIEERRKNKGR